MLIRYDAVANAVYIYLEDDILAGSAVKTYPCNPLEVDGMINLDFDRDGRLIGVEVLDARKMLPPEVMRLAQ